MRTVSCCILVNILFVYVNVNPGEPLNDRESF